MRSRRFDFDEKEEIKPETRTMTKGEKSSMVLAVGILVYALVVSDLPVLFFAVSFLIFMLCPLAETFGGRYGKSLRGFLQGFALVLFLGALFLAFI